MRDNWSTPNEPQPAITSHAQLLNLFGDAVMVTQTDGRITFWNRAAEQLFGWSAEEALGRLPRELVVPVEFHGVAAEARATAESGQHWRGEFTLQTRNGVRFPARATVSPVLGDAGELVGMIAIAHDVTDEKRAIDDFRHLEEQLLQARKLEAIGRLAGSVAHDFNNTLSVILGYTELLLEEDRWPEVAGQQLQDIHAATEKAMRLTQQLLAFSRHQVLAPKVLNLNDVVTDTERFLRPLIGENIDLRTDLAADLAPVRVDQGQLEQVLMNLVVNARDAMPRGGTLTISTQNIQLGERMVGELPAGVYVRLAVRDTGVGMDTETQARIFEPFFTTKAVGQGTGLGLSTAFGVVKQSGGHIDVISAPGDGSIFNIYLPRADQAADPVVTAPRSPQAPSGSGTILLVEDDAGVRRMTRMILEGSGYVVLEAPSGADALQIARQPAPIDLLLSDLVMPNMSGQQLARELIQLHPETKVLFMSGYAQEEISRQGAAESDNAFIAKPFSPASLARKIHDLVSAP
jgi:two-component system, cell cycle sensor histidine kinase and response regulator CckA